PRAVPRGERARLPRRTADLRAAATRRGCLASDRGAPRRRVPAGAEARDRQREVGGDGRPRAVRRLARQALAAVRRRGEAPQPGDRVMATRIGVDVGGTFTDLIFYDDASGEVVVAKEPTTPAAPEQGVAAAVAAAVTPEQVRRSEYF